MEMGLGPALTNESCRGRPMAASRPGPVVMSAASSQSLRSMSMSTSMEVSGRG